MATNDPPIHYEAYTTHTTSYIYIKLIAHPIGTDPAPAHVEGQPCLLYRHQISQEAAQAQITILSDENKTLKASNIPLEAIVEQYKTEQSSSKAANHVTTS